MNFQYPFHNQIFKVLQCLDRTFLDRCHIAFGGGTLLALAYGEYRISRDIDFLCPYGEAFSRLRREIYDRGYAALFQLNLSSNIQFPNEIRTDRDGVRLTVCKSIVLMKLWMELMHWLYGLGLRFAIGFRRNVRRSIGFIPEQWRNLRIMGTALEMMSFNGGRRTISEVNP